MHRDFIDRLGGPAVVGSIVGVSGHAAWNWRMRGIPWRFRNQIALFAMTRGVQPPADFLQASPVFADPAMSGDKPSYRVKPARKGAAA